MKFFRKIRQKLLTENSFSKYMIYALGEIILVVIGILIAIQINNWRERQKEDAVVENYLRQLKSDLAADTSYYEESISYLESKVGAYQDYKKVFSESDLNISKVIAHIEKLDFDHNIIEFRTSTIKTLMSTGEIKLIPTALRDQLILYDTRQSQVKLSLNGYNESSKVMIQNVMSKGANSDLLRRATIFLK